MQDAPDCSEAFHRMRIGTAVQAVSAEIERGILNGMSAPGTLPAAAQVPAGPIASSLAASAGNVPARSTLRMAPTTA